MGDYKNQHTVTEAYLRGFTAADRPNTLWRYDKKRAFWKESNVSKASVRFYIYSFRESDGQWNHKAEVLLSEIESNALPLLPKLESGQWLTAIEKDRLALFIAAMFRRPAGLVEHLQEHFLKVANDRINRKLLFDSMLPKLRAEFPEDQIDSARKAFAEGEFDTGTNDAKAMQLSVWFNAMPRHSHLIGNMHWQIWKAAPGCTFLTSDAPAYVRSEGHYDDKRFIAAGDTARNAELIFPVSKKSVLIAKHKPCKEVCKATKSRAKELNALTIRMAHRYVFVDRNTDPFQRIAELNRRFSAPLPDFAYADAEYKRRIVGSK